jgi:hypothetical protein
MFNGSKTGSVYESISVLWVDYAVEIYAALTRHFYSQDLNLCMTCPVKVSGEDS